MNTIYLSQVRFIIENKIIKMPMRKIFTLQFSTKIFNPDKSINSYAINESVDGQEFKAPDRCVENIMNFARSYRVEETKSTGKIEMILN